MLKINNNLIFKSLGFVGFLALAFIVASPINAEAYVTKGAYKVSEGGSTGVVTSSTPPAQNPVDSCQNQAPKISYISPSSATVNSGAKKVKVVGTCFTTASIVRFNSANRPTTYVDSKNLVVDLSSNDMKAVGKFLITVSDPKGFSNSVYFTISKAVAKAKKSTVATAVKATDNNQIACNTGANLADNSTDKSTSGLVAAAIFGGDDLMPDSLLGWIFLFVFILLAVTLWRKLYVTEKEHHAPLKHA